MSRLSSAQIKKLRAEMVQTWGEKCMYCGDKTDDLQIDHILPVALGGGSEDANLVLACRGCNQSKGKHRLGEWYGLSFIDCPRWILDAAGVKPEPWHGSMIKGHPNYGYWHRHLERNRVAKSGVTSGVTGAKPPLGTLAPSRVVDPCSCLELTSKGIGLQAKTPIPTMASLTLDGSVLGSARARLKALRDPRAERQDTGCAA